ncbi:MAG: ABC transporter ATP-binding protein [Conexivisphaerales archaeon]
MHAAIEADNVTKVYENKVKALDDFSLLVERGTIFSLLGRNGAGKTTFARIVATILRPSSGDLRVMGYDLESEIKKIRSLISVVPQEGRPFSLQTPLEHVLMYLIARGWSVADARRRAKEVLEELELDGYRDKICAVLSGGLRQRVMLAMAVSTQPELLLLDEPTIGLDPVARIKMWSTIEKLSSSGTTVFLTTHYMDEAEALSKKVAIVESGRKIVEGEPARVKGSLNSDTVVVINGSYDDVTLKRYGEIRRSGMTARVYTHESAARELVNDLLSKNRSISFSVRPISLEDVFIYLVGELDD